MTPRYQFVHDMRMPLGFPAAGFESGLGYIPEAGDVFVCSYPKSGTTWLQYIVYLLVRGRPLAAVESLTEVFPHLEEVGRDPVAKLESPRLIKTHLPFGLTPFSSAATYCLIVRNPFDCCVSFYHHTR
ncbi:MAG: sulfotransferase domain-containing protein, partial [Gammaproteobacteria bacterium]